MPNRPSAAAGGEERGDLAIAALVHDRVQLGAIGDGQLIGDEGDQLGVLLHALDTLGIEEVEHHPAALATAEIERFVSEGGADGGGSWLIDEERIDRVGGRGVAAGQHDEQRGEHDRHRQGDERRDPAPPLGIGPGIGLGTGRAVRHRR